MHMVVTFFNSLKKVPMEKSVLTQNSTLSYMESPGVTEHAQYKKYTTNFWMPNT